MAVTAPGKNRIMIFAERQRTSIEFTTTPTHHDTNIAPAALWAIRARGACGIRSGPLIVFLGKPMKNTHARNAKRSIVVRGHKTSVSLEEAFWNGLKEAAAARGTTVRALVSEIATQRVNRGQLNLSSALRIFVLEFYRDQIEEGRAGLSEKQDLASSWKAGEAS